MKTTIQAVLILLFCSLSCAVYGQQEWTVRTAKKWAKARSWSEGWHATPHRSTDWVEFADQYARNRELWQQAFRFLNETDLAAIPLGTYSIVPDRCWATVSEYIPKSPAEANIESHRQVIDLQYTLSGEERMGLAKTPTQVKFPYNPDRDIAFYTAEKLEYYNTSPKIFFLFFPGDIHQPSVSRQNRISSRKIVLKIEYIP
ncbi:MAG: YhcH/YjgK/YiaL family protein [Rikenellaceae bacterium]|nr:YhcH/YjgK/YiaL family protein [Rikenellaceae bacterium]